MIFESLSRIVAAMVLLGCETSAPFPQETASPGELPPSAGMVGALSFEPERMLDQVEPVTAVQVALPFAPADGTMPYIIEGPVSQASVTRLKAGELTAAVADRIVPVVTRALSGGWRIRPEVPLHEGEEYAVISPYGAHGSFRVGASNYSLLDRIWPLPGAGGAVTAVYCGEAAPTDVTDVLIDGTGELARCLPGLNDAGLRNGSCVRLSVPANESEPQQPPLTLGNYSFHPARLPSGALAEPIAPIECYDGESTLGVGCTLARPGEVIVRPPPGAQLWAMNWQDRFHLQFAEDGRRFVIPELGLERQIQLLVSVFDAAGREIETHARVSLPPPEAHIVINEVMANPVGPEPKQEWIEIYNAGTASAELSQLSMRDSDGSAIDLPPGVLEPGQFALLVRDDFDLSALESKVAAPNLLVFRLAHLSANGLSNSGESVSLVDKQGVVVSTFPPLAAKSAGVSIARRNGWSLDEDPASFANHGVPGASPGAANTFIVE